MAVQFFNDTRYYSFSVKLQLSECENAAKPVENTKNIDSEWINLGVELSSWVRKNILYTEKVKVDTSCSQISSFEGELDIHSGLILACIFVIFITLVVPLTFVKIFDFFEKKSGKFLPEQITNTDDTFSEDSDAIENKETAVTKPIQKGLIPLSHIAYHTGYAFTPSCDLPSFLRRTVDCLFQELDKLLIGRNPTQHEGPLHSTVTSSVRLPRRPVPRATGRQNSSPSLSSQNNEDDTEAVAYREFLKDIVYNSICTQMIDLPDSVRQSLLGNSKKWMDFYLNRCMVSFEEVCVSNLIVKYTIHLLDKILKTMKPYNGIRYIHCCPTGSMLKGTKVGAANQSDYFFVFQCTQFGLSSAVDHSVNSDIPPGKLVLIVAESGDNEDDPSKLLKQFQSRNCISPQEFLNSVCELTDIAVQKLYKEGRPMIDRLPFRIQRITSPGLNLSLDTRNVMGFRNPDIRIQLIPSLLLSSNKWINPVNLYAVPSWSNVDFKRKVTPRDRYSTQPIQTTTHDLFWSMSFGELEHLFFNKVDQKCYYHGVFGCHRIVIQILKFLFSPQSKKTLLSRGEVTSYMIETIVSYMLVESKADQWGIDSLSDRVSDAINFLRRALQNGRLPSFFINNPHLAGESEFLKQIKLLSPGRQENLLGNVSTDTLGKMLNFVNSRLAEYDLENCVKSEYSDDMWEYEYFVYL
ncbi:uncharacterized protein LOC133181700 [Saccostrea echinata]|uniref:uncharacterized protein LOC133181700 n=1 Tax=Saccostrea echinata TaxID=191078 RepID=UPI002A83F101|nr:uncharacterized protein LOC133181700 [Saccostrea echinata]